MTAIEIKKRIRSLCTHVLFEYRGKSCGIDPFSEDHFDMWCGEDAMVAKSIDEVMQAPFFDGNALQDIIGEIEETEI